MTSPLNSPPTGQSAYGPPQGQGAYPPPEGAYPPPASGGYQTPQVTYMVDPLAVPGSVINTPNGPLVVGNRSKLAAGLCGILLGGLGLARFLRGDISMGVVQVLLSIITFGAASLWGFIEGILILVANPGDTYSFDADGYLLHK